MPRSGNVRPQRRGASLPSLDTSDPGKNRTSPKKTGITYLVFGSVASVPVYVQFLLVMTYLFSDTYTTIDLTNLFIAKSSV